MIGSRIHHYEISSQLGKGGMGEVWRARDTKLGRDVAIKTLPPEFASDSERVSRLEREARLLASVNHPNVAAIYGLEESSGARFLVLELVEGETLAERLKRPMLTMKESLGIALQVAQALEAAHEKGVIHRDLKPGNIKITPEGKVKVLDFGLAKALDPTESYAPGSSAMSNSPTLSMAATQAGIILGTAGYMSPEQARGEATDRRTDIWSFGCVLFEMLARRSTFEGRTVSDVLAGVLRAEPEWSSLPADLHPRIKLLLERCLEKEPRNRYRDIADARVDIEKVLAERPSSQSKAIAPTDRPAAGSSRLWIAAVILATVIGAAAAWFLKPAPRDSRDVSRFSYVLPEGQQPRASGRPIVAVSPDGKRFIYNTNAGLFLRSMDAFDARVIPGTEGAITAPVFSPDGLWILFFSQDDLKLKKIAVSGGTAVTLCDAALPLGLNWAADGTILFVQPTGIMRVSENGGVPELIIKTGTAEDTPEAIANPQLLPDGKSVLFTVSTYKSGVTDWDRARIVVESLDTKKRTTVWEGGAHGQYVPTGHLVYLVGNVLFAVRFDPDTLTTTGGPIPIVEGVARNVVNSMTGQYAFSNAGTLVYVRGSNGTAANARRILALVDRKGGMTPLNVPPAPYLHPRISPDGARVAVQTLDENNRSAIWVYDLSGNRAIQQLTQAGNNSRPIWTPDSRRLTFTSDRDGTPSIYWQLADGSGVAERLTKAEPKIEHWSDSWSGDGKTLSFTRYGGLGNQSIWTVQVNPLSEPKDFGVKESGGSAFSPDGKWLAYRASEGGFQIYVQPFPPTGAVYKVTQKGGSYPLWSRDQSELFYRRPLGGNTPVAESTPSDQLVSVDITTRGIINYSNEQTIPIQGFLSFFGSRDYDVSKDGQKFLMVFPVDRSQARTPPRPQIDVVLNWFTELKQRAPGK